MGGPAARHAAHEAAGETRAEFYVAVKGKVVRRAEGTVNAELPTGEIEVAVTAFETLSASALHVIYERDPATIVVGGTLSLRPRQRRPLPDPGYSPEGALDVRRLAFWMPDGKPAGFQGEFHTDGRVDFVGRL